MELEEGQNRLVCPSCRADQCIACGVEWHKGVTCEAYQQVRGCMLRLSCCKRPLPAWLTVGHIRRLHLACLWVFPDAVGVAFALFLLALETLPQQATVCPMSRHALSTLAPLYQHLPAPM